MLIARTTSFSIAQIPTHPTTPLVGTASQGVAAVNAEAARLGIHILTQK